LLIIVVTDIGFSTIRCSIYCNGVTFARNRIDGFKRKTLRRRKIFVFFSPLFIFFLHFNSARDTQSVHSGGD